MLKILIADDDRLIRILLENFLRNAGHAVFAASNGREAFEIAQKHDIDLALMDMNMPELDGWTATLLIRDRFDNRIEVVAVTAFDLPGDRARAAAAGCTRFLAKPIDVDSLAETIATFTNDRAGR
jgi:CheY-like chemotaxis protein